MIFAAIDYFRYRRRLGRYSEAALRAMGLRRACEYEFLGWEQYPLGWIMFAHTAESTISWVVMYVTNSVLSHTAMVYGEGIVHDVTTEGVVRHSLSDYFDEISFLGFRDLRPGVDPDRMQKVLDSTLGGRFNWTGLVNLGLHTAIANSTNFAWRLALDIVLILAIIATLAWLVNPSIGVVATVLLASYLGIVVINRTWRKKAIEAAFAPSER